MIKNKNRNRNKNIEINIKDIIISIIIIIFSILIGYITNDLLIGSAILITGLLSSYFAGERKKVNYIFSFISYILAAYVSYKNNLYGIFIFCLFIFAPFQIYGYFSWQKNLEDEKEVKPRKFTLKKSLIVILSCLTFSCIIGYLLTLIPKQNLAFMDAASNCINLCAIILLSLRYKEAWWLWFISGIIDLIIWVVMYFNNGYNTMAMIIITICFFVFNLIGIIKWTKKTKYKETEIQR